MDAGTAQIQAVDRGPVPRPHGHGPKEERLVQRHLPVIDVALREPEPGLEVEGREDLTIEDQPLEPGDVVREDRDDPVGELLPLRIPPAATQRVWRVLPLRRHHVHSGWRKVRVYDRRDEDVEDGLPRRLTVLRVVVRSLDVFEGRTDSEMGGHAIACRGKIRWPSQREVYFRNDPVHLEIPDVQEEFRAQFLRVDEVKERSLRIRVRRNGPRTDRLTAREFDPGDAPVGALDA